MRKVFAISILLFLLPASVNAQNTWIKKSSKPGGDIFLGASFSIGSKAYIGVGANTLTTYTNGFWEYDPSKDSWTQKANFQSGRTGTIAFAVGNKGYIGLGQSGSGPTYSDIWEYDPATNKWTSKANFSGGQRMFATAFSIGNKGYVGTGTDSTFAQKNDFWEFDPGKNSWTQKANVGSVLRKNASSFTVDKKGYITLGQDHLNNNLKDIWEYNPQNNSWTQKKNFAGKARRFAVGFGIGSKGFISTGTDGSSVFKDLWQFDPSANQWVKKADFPDTARYAAVGLAVNDTAYLGMGYDNTNFYNDWWQYTPDSAFVAPVSNFKVSDTAFCIGDSVYFTSLASNNPTSYTWYFPGGNPFSSSKVNPTITYDSAGTYDVILVVHNSVGSDSLVKSDLIEIHSIPIPDAGNDTSICVWENVQLNASGGVAYSWTPPAGLSDPDIPDPIASPLFSTQYVVTVANAFGCSAKDTLEVTVLNLPSVSAGSDSWVCKEDSVTLNATGAATYSWKPSSSLDDSTSSAPKAYPALTTTFTVTGIATNGCSGKDSVKVNVYPLPPVPSITQNGNLLIASSGANSYIWYRNDSVIPGVTGDSLTISQSAYYSVDFVDGNGCKSRSEKIFASVVGIEKIVASDLFSLYPNPTSGLLKVKWDPREFPLKSIAVCGPSGKIFLTKYVDDISSENLKLNLSDLSDGIYLIVFTDIDGKTEINKVVIQK